MKIPKTTIVRAGGGIPCPRCNQVSQRREHKEIRAKQLRAPYYYSKWYYCRNSNCPTRVFTFEEDKVFPDGKAPVVKTEHTFSTGDNDELVLSTYSGPPPWED